MKQRGPIVITGFMGCGKTRVARELAQRLNILMVDLDETITQREGRTPAQIIVNDGEPAFRTIESNVLRSLLRTNVAGVIALGGGAWIQETNRALIDEHNCLTVWLDAPFEVCWDRIETSGDDRPLAKTREQAHALYERRRPVYQLASIHIPLKAEEDFDALLDRISRVILSN
jgi:shikimate kinase